MCQAIPKEVRDFSSLCRVAGAELLAQQQQERLVARSHLSCDQRDATLLQVARDFLQLLGPIVAHSHCLYETLHPPYDVTILTGPPNQEQQEG